MKRWFALLTLSACATAGPDPAGSPPDASNPPPPPGDAPPADMPPPPPDDVTLQQTGDMNIASAVPGCGNLLGDVFAMGWYRAFPLADHQISGPFHVQKVTFGVQSAQGSPTLTVKLGTFTGTLDGTTISLSKITQLTSTDVTVTGTGASLVDAPIAADVPAGSTLVVEIAQKQTTVDDPMVVFGATGSAETHLSYMRAAACNGGSSTPHSMADWGSAASHLLITVTGTR